MPRAIRPYRRAVLALGAALAALVLLAAPARGHGLAGKLTVLRAEQTTAERAEIEVGLLYANDAEPADTATVTVTLTAPDGSTVGPVPAERSRGSRYVAAIAVTGPGIWAFTVTSETPAASATGAIEIAPPSITTEPPTTIASRPPVPVVASPSPAPPTGSPGSLPAVFLALLATAAVVIAARRWRARRAPAPADRPPGDNERQPEPDLVTNESV